MMSIFLPDRSITFISGGLFLYPKIGAIPAEGGLFLSPKVKAIPAEGVMVPGDDGLGGSMEWAEAARVHS